MFSKKIILSLMVIVFLTFTNISSARAFAGGDGSSGNPYQITNCVQLQEMNNNPNAHYILINDIDCSDTVNWNSGAGFAPISGFTGTFDGQAHKITGLFINRPFCLGLFSSTGSGAIIKNVGLVDVKITGSGYPGGSNYIGGLAGGNVGTITNSYVTGSVSGDLRIGGLVGENSGTITNSYTTASVTGVYHVGGLAGSNYGAITNSYATGRVTAYWLQGGLIGWNNLGTITNSYWDIETSGQSTSDGGTGKTTAQMMQQGTFVDWDFVNIWAIKEGVSYPYLQWQAEVTFHQDGVGTDFTGTVLTVDGTGYTRTDLPKTFTWTIGTDHTFAYHSPLDVSAVKRYVWTHTLGLCTAQSGTITVPSEGGSVTGYYKTQYYLTVVSPYDTPGGMDWYDKDDTAYATLDYGIEDLAPGQRAVFTGWTGDASGTGLTSDPITMNAPKTATALWVIQWHLDVEVIPPEAGTIPGEDWYNNCTTVTLTADTYLPSEAGVGGVRYKFSYWDVDGTPVAGNPIDVHMDATHTATAHYTVQYYLTVKTDPAGIATIPGEGWYDPSTWVTLTAPLETNVKYHFANWKVDTAPEPFLENVIKVHMDEPKTATAVYKDYLGHAGEEIGDLEAYLNALRAAGKIGKKEYDHFIKDLDKVEKDIDKAIKNFDTARDGYDDKINGFEDLRHAVMKLEHMIKDVKDWAKKGKIPAANATWIITELEAIRMKLVDKARAEALAERALALKAIEDAKAKGKDTTKAEKEIAKVDCELAKAEQKIAEGKLSQAIQHFKHAFAHSHHAIKKAYDPTWTIDYKDWIDELEEEDP